MGSKKIRVALVGIGNCASSLVQGLTYYRDADGNEPVPGLMHVSLGGYHIGDIEISAAFDVAASKVGHDVAEAIYAHPNNTHRFADVAPMGVRVDRGRTLDGIGKYLHDVIEESDEPVADVMDILRRTNTDVLVSYLPVGSELATQWYAEQALEAGCGFINCIPVFIASKCEWEQKFAARGLPIIGDDIKSQVGATIVHRMLVNLFRERGVRLDRTYQLNTGGNTDFLNMRERDRLASKKISKTEAVQSVAAERLEDDNVHIGPSDYVPWQNDNKVCFLRMEGTMFGGVPMNLELRLSVEDSPNSAGVAIDMIRCAKLAKDRGLGGPIDSASAYFCKHPRTQMTDDLAAQAVEDFIVAA
jgi:myo-inositol-1-phosphate synthase